MTGTLHLLLVAWYLTVGSVLAQPTSPAPAPAQDPLMTLMLSQPRIEVDGPIVATATFEPPVVQPGETAIYRVSLNALEASIDWPEQVPAEEELHLRAGGRGQILQMAGTNMQPRTTFLYRARADTLGRFVVPDFTVQAYGKPVNVPAASLEVTPRPPLGAGKSPSLVLELPSTNLFVGQAIYARILYPGEAGGAVQGLAQVQLNGDGFIADLGAARQRIEAVRRGEAMVPTYIYEAPLIPVAVGTLSVFAQGYSIGNRFAGPIVITGPAVVAGGMPQYILLDSEPVGFQVRPLPVEGRLPGFSGAVGLFQVEPPRLDSYELRVGEPAKIRVSIRGQGNLSRLIPPAPPQPKDWQIFSSAGDNLPPQIVQAQGFVTFNYTIVPLTETTTRTPAIPFSYFNPVTEKYVDATIPPVEVKVLPGKAPAQPEALAQAEALEEKREPELALSGLAAAPGRPVGNLAPAQQQPWFPIVQLAPGLFFVGLYGWDRRRRYLEQHPGIVRRRRARRALRRQRRVIDRALRAGDAPQFASAAVQALRIASAPHYPAEPRALVCADVLPLLSGADANGRPAEVVRKMFAVNDAAQFGSSPPVNGELLALRGDFEQVLLRLEEKL